MWTLTKTLLWWEAKKLGYNLFDYIREKVISISQLLPIYDYLALASSETVEQYPTGYPVNPFLENLYDTEVELLDSGVRIANIIGNTGTSTISSITVASSTAAGLWEYGFPESLNYGIGDGTVPIESAGYITTDVSMFDSAHIDLPSKSESFIYRKLTGKEPTQIITNGLKPNALFLIKMFSPADIQIISPDNRRIGKDFVTGQEINEIDGAFYSGFLTDNEYAVIPNPMDGEYKVITKGTGSGGGYTVATGFITDTQSVEKDFSGNILPNMLTDISVNISSASSAPLEITPDDTDSPVITIFSPEARDYARSATTTISAISTDSGTGVFSFGIALDDKAVSNGGIIDLFFEKLGAHTVSASSTDFVGNFASSSITFRVVATPESTISDIERAYALHWITRKEARNYFIQKIKGMMRIEKRIEKVTEKMKDGKRKEKLIERLETRIDKVLARALLRELKLYNRKVLNEQAYNLLKEDIEWLINNY